MLIEKKFVRAINAKVQNLPVLNQQINKVMFAVLKRVKEVKRKNVNSLNDVLTKRLNKRFIDEIPILTLLIWLKKD
jgi:hypothetical protein